MQLWQRERNEGTGDWAGVQEHLDEADGTGRRAVGSGGPEVQPGGAAAAAQPSHRHTWARMQRLTSSPATPPPFPEGLPHAGARSWPGIKARFPALLWTSGLPPLPAGLVPLTLLHAPAPHAMLTCANPLQAPSQARSTRLTGF
eukprot:293533-Chlamydomonas_euryale.AAC.7